MLDSSTLEVQLDETWRCVFAVVNRLAVINRTLSLLVKDSVSFSSHGLFHERAYFYQKRSKYKNRDEKEKEKEKPLI